MENTTEKQEAVVTEPVAEPIHKHVEVCLQTLLQSGGHFGTKTSSWNPKCAPFIYGVRNGVYIINLEDTLRAWDNAKQLITEQVMKGGTVLFVGTKKQSMDSVIKHAQRCGAFYVNYKWSAGTLTNFKVLRKSVEKMEGLEKIVKEAETTGKSKYTKKELLLFKRSINKMLRSFGGIRQMKSLPTLVFITDANNESLAVSEANKTGVPIISLADTDCDPDKLTYPIPANDDAVRTLDLFCSGVADAVIDGKTMAVKMAVVKENEALVEAPLPPEMVEKQNKPKESIRKVKYKKDLKSNRYDRLNKR